MASRVRSDDVIITVEQLDQYATLDRYASNARSLKWRGGLKRSGYDVMAILGVE